MFGEGLWTPQACYRRYAVWIASLTCLVVVAGLLAGGAIYIANIPEPDYVTILISIDGVRPDYLTRGVSPNLLRLGIYAGHEPKRP